MELVYQSVDQADVNYIMSLLEDNGIPSFITNENTNNLRRHSFSGMGVFVHINSQLEEAIKLINNPKYIVKNKVNIIEYYEHINNTVNKSEVNSHIINTLVKTLSGLLLLAVIGIIISTNT